MIFDGGGGVSNVEDIVVVLSAGNRGSGGNNERAAAGTVVTVMGSELSWWGWGGDVEGDGAIIWCARVQNIIMRLYEINGTYWSLLMRDF